jgi:hypothetical protein
MLSQAEMIDGRDKLRTAANLIEGVKATFFAAGDISGARLLNEVVHALEDEIAALDKAIGAAKP